MNARKVPSVRPGIRAQLFCCFGERDVHTRLRTLETLKKKLQPERCLTGTRIPFDKVNTMGGKPPAQQVVETADPSGRLFSSQTSRRNRSRAFHPPSTQTDIFVTCWCNSMLEVSRFTAST